MKKISTDFNENIIPLVDKMYQMYQFIGMSKDAFYNFLIDGIKTYPFDEKKEESFYDFYIKTMTEVIHQYIKSTLESKDYKILINFIDTLWMDFDIEESLSYKKALDGLKKLDVFLDSLDFVPEFVELTSLISMNPKLQAVLKIITDTDKEKVASFDFSGYNNITGMLIETYCVENCLGSQGDLEDIDNIDFNLDDSFLFLMTGMDVDADKKTDDMIVASASDFSSIEYYNQLIRENPVLKEDEVEALIESLKEGNSAARDKLVYSNLGLVAFVAKEFVGRGVPFDDLMQEGIIGLTKGIERFELTKGTKLSTYVVWWIRMKIFRAVDEQARNIRVSVYMLEKLKKFEEAVYLLTIKYGRNPRVDEIAREMELDEKKVLSFYSCRKDTVSLSEIGDVVDPKENLEEAHLSLGMAELIKLCRDAGLTERELDILLHHVAYEDLTFRELGEKYGLSGERIRKIEMGALKKITRFKGTEGLAVYTDYPDANLEFLRKVRGNELVGSRNLQRASKQMKTVFEHVKVSPKNYYQCIEPNLRESDRSIIEKKFGKVLENPAKDENAGINGDFKKFPLTNTEDNYGLETVILDDKEDMIVQDSADVLDTASVQEEIDVKMKEKKKRRLKTIFELVGVSPNDYYQYIEPQLTSMDRTLIKGRYGEDLEHPECSLDFYGKERINFYSVVVPKMRRIAASEGLIEQEKKTNLDSDSFSNVTSVSGNDDSRVIDGSIILESLKEVGTTSAGQVEKSTVIKNNGTVLCVPVDQESTSLSKVQDHFNSEKEKLSAMSEAQLDDCLHFLAGDRGEIERRIIEKGNKLDEAISLCEIRKHLLERKRELDLEIASKLNDFNMVKEKVR